MAKREVISLRHKTVFENDLRELPFVKGSTEYEYSLKKKDQGLYWEYELKVIIKDVDNELLKKLTMPSVYVINGISEVLTIGRVDCPVMAGIKVDDQCHVTVKFSDVYLNRTLL